jgi:hypothetical protein
MKIIMDERQLWLKLFKELACPLVMFAPSFPCRPGPAFHLLNVFFRPVCAMNIGDCHLAPVQRRLEKGHFPVAVQLLLERASCESTDSSIFQKHAKPSQMESVGLWTAILSMLKRIGIDRKEVN